MRTDLTIYYDAGVIDRKLIEEFENEIDKTFPELYKNLLTKHNGVQFEENIFDFMSPNCEDERDCCFGAYGDVQSEAVRKMQLHNDCGHINLTSFARSGNGDYICFDYRKDPKTCNPR